MPKKRRVAPEYKFVRCFGRNTTLHRAIVERSLGYRLPRSVHVHHINGDKTDNRLENLEVMSASDHGKLHSPQKHPSTSVCAVCGVVFTPHKTKRARQKTCGNFCARQLAAERRRKLSREQRTELLALREEGWTQVALANRYGVTQSAVWAMLKTLQGMDGVGGIATDGSRGLDKREVGQYSLPRRPT